MAVSRHRMICQVTFLPFTILCTDSTVDIVVMLQDSTS